MICKNCGYPIEDGAAFCGYCGERIITEEAANNHYGTAEPVPYSTTAHDFVSVSSVPCSDANNRMTPLKQKKRFPISVIVLSALALVYNIALVIYDSTQSVEITTRAVLLIIFLAIALLCFILTPKSRAYITIAAVWFFPIWNSVLLYIDISQNDRLFYSTTFETAFILTITLFALIYTIFVAVKKARISILPILMILFVIIWVVLDVTYEILLVTGNLNLYNTSGEIFNLRYYNNHLTPAQKATTILGSVVSGLWYPLFMTAFVIAAFSLLSKKEKKSAYSGVAYPQPIVQKFCPSCGIQYTADKKFCDQCGGALKEMAATTSPNPQSNAYQGQNPMDAPSGGYAALGFFIPLVGLILYLTWKEQFPLRARSAGKGALIGFIVSIVLSIAAVLIPFVIVGVML